MGARPRRKGRLGDQEGEGQENIADGLIKHVGRAKMDYYMKECGFVRRSGRHELRPDWEMTIERTEAVSPFMIFSGSHSREHDFYSERLSERVFVQKRALCVGACHLETVSLDC